MPSPQRFDGSSPAGKIEASGCSGEFAPSLSPLGPRTNARNGPPSSVLITNVPLGATIASVGELPGGALTTGPKDVSVPSDPMWNVAYVGETLLRLRTPSCALFVTINVLPETPTLA